MNRIILASTSVYRAQLLANAGIRFDTEAARINERDVEAPLREAGMTPADTAEILAIAKADDVSSRHPGAWVIGSDQVLSLDGEVLHKPADMEGARRRLLALAGRTHHLHTAIAIVRDGDTVWTHVEDAKIRFRDYGPVFVGQHLARVGEKALTSVGAYQIEGEGVQLMDRIEGDFFTIMGLPLLQLLAGLRDLGVIET